MRRLLGLLLGAALLSTGAAAATTPAGASAGGSTGVGEPARAVAVRPARLPGGGTAVFARKRFLIAHYGFAHPSTTFILGQRTPDADFAKMRAEGRRYRLKGEQVLPVYELVVTVADAEPGPDGNYNHDLLHSAVQTYIDAAHRNGALLILDLQPGREDFTTVAKRWEWALLDPWVGLGLDTEWRMGAGQVPGTDIGSVGAQEINRTSAWLAGLVKRAGLPQKVLLFHQYKAGNVRKVKAVARRKQLALVQHIDAAGTPAQKQFTYQALAQPRKFDLGYMIFTRSDHPRMRPKAVRRLDPPVRFVSYQ